MPRTKRHDRRRRRFTPTEAFYANSQLRYGPWKLTADGRHSDWSLPSWMHASMFATDTEAREAMVELEQHYEHWQPLDKTDWAYWRFIRERTPKEALSRTRWSRKLRDRAHVLEQIREYEICDWHSYWGATPLEERRRLIRRAGRPDLIQPALCERFGVD